MKPIDIFEINNQKLLKAIDICHFCPNKKTFNIHGRMVRSMWACKNKVMRKKENQVVSRGFEPRPFSVLD